MSGSNLPPPDPTALPLYDFANKGLLVGLLQQFRKSMSRNTQDMLPATVISYDRANNVASVQPSVHMVTTDGTLVGRASIASVPVLALGGGNFVVNFPLVSGSRGWIKASDRDISLYLQSSAAAAPNSSRMHSFSDGLFIPDVVEGFTIAGEDANNAVFQSLDGTVKIALGSSTIKIAAETSITLTAAGHTVLINSAGIALDGKLFAPHEHINGGGSGNSGPVA